MKVEDALKKIKLINSLIEDVARGSLTEKSAGQLEDILEEYKSFLSGMEVSSSQQIDPDWVEEYGF